MAKKQPQRPRRPLSKRKLWIFRLVTLGIVFLCFEVFSYIGLRALENKLSMDPMRHITPDKVESFLAKRYDPDLGWGPVSNTVNSIGARSNHEYVDLEHTISIYGDSYAWGDGVSVEDSWAMQLEDRIDCGVLNFGVGGYGTDQAQMRMERKYPSARSSTVVMCIQVENVMRNVNIYRGFFRPGFDPPKPRYIPKGDALVVFNPFDSPEAVREILLEDPDKLIELGKKYDSSCREMLVGGRPWRMGFPYTYQVAVRLPFICRHVGYRLSKLGRHVHHFDEGSEGLDIMQRIIQRFQDYAEQEGFTPAVVIFPTPRDVFRHVAYGDVPYKNLITFLDGTGLPYHDLLEDLSQTGDPRDLMVNRAHHVNEEGSRIVAESVVEFLHSADLIPTATANASSAAE